MEQADLRDEHAKNCPGPGRGGPGHVPPPPPTDPRYPSGEWHGYWLQGPRRTPIPMWLTLAFRDGTISGEGADATGAFTVAGTHANDGSCAFEKRYGDDRVIHYRGQHVAEGPHVGVSGTWTLGEWSERFWLEPR